MIETSVMKELIKNKNYLEQMKTLIENVLDNLDQGNIKKFHNLFGNTLTPS